MLSLILEALAGRAAENDPVLEKQFRMIELRLTPPILPAELKSLQDYMLTIFKRSSFINESPSPNLTLSAHHSASNKAVPISKVMTAPTNSSSEANVVNGEQKNNDTVREQLNQKNHEFLQMRATLSRNVDEAIAQNQEFGVLLGVELEELREAKCIQDVEKRRVTLIDEINKFVKKHRLLSDKFDSANKYLNLVESSNQHLSDELDRAKLLSLTDELTGLPNRRAFLRRMEDEVGRGKRYGIPLSIIMIDLDGFKAINDLRGHSGGDVVLQSYAEQILSVFRHHDMVARYGGEEFAVILPNTGAEGSFHALQKLQICVSEEICTHNGERFPLPTFSAGLAEYRHSETLNDLIERADTALYLAKRLGRNRIEIAAAPMETEGAGERDNDFNAARHA